MWELTKKVFYLIQIAAICLLMGCRGKSSSKDVNVTPGEPIPPPIVNAVNVYIENSGSMDGYMYGDTKFKNAISYLLVQLDNYYKDKVNIRFINSKIDSTTITNIDLGKFADAIDILWNRSIRAGRGDTDLDNIFTNILSQTNEQTISILFSDCIYSMKQGVDGIRFFQKNATIHTFNNKLSESSVAYTTAIVKMSSKFNGKYFPYTGDSYWFYILSSDESNHKRNFVKNAGNTYVQSKTHYIIDDRPYYVCIIGNQLLINDFNEKPKLKLEEIEGYENKYVLSSENSESIYYSVLTSSYNEGRFTIDRDKSTNDFTRGIKGVKLPRVSGGGSGDNSALTFAIAVDFNRIEKQVDKDYILNPKSYEVTTGNFDVIDIVVFDSKKLHKSDQITIKNHNPTHIIKLRSTVKKLNNTEAVLVLKKQMPEWVACSNTEDDTVRENLIGTTFGLKNWVEGINEAYETIYPENKNYFECTISIK